YNNIQAYMTETNHVYLPAVVMASKRFWDRLTAEDQQILVDACHEAKIHHREVSRKMEKDVVQEFIKGGMQVNMIEPAEKARMIEATAAVTEQYKAELGAELVNQVVATVEAVRKK